MRQLPRDLDQNFAQELYIHTQCVLRSMWPMRPLRCKPVTPVLTIVLAVDRLHFTKWDYHEIIPT